MKKLLGRLSVFMVLASICASGPVFAEDRTFTVIIDNCINGMVRIDPLPLADGRYKEGRVITITAVPDAGYVLDSCYFSIPGVFGRMYYESMTSPFKVVIDQEKHVGASFIEKAAVDHLDVIQDVVYAKPGVKTLKYDVYTPKGAKDLPMIIIIHGGGWAANTEDIMRGMARELTRDGKYVVCSIDYRWREKLDGDPKDNTISDLIGDVYGAIAHIMEHAAAYGGDPTRVALTGDSAGGHLSAAAANMSDRIGKGGFGKTPSVFEFLPSYIPKNKAVEQVKSEMISAIKAVAPSYGVFSAELLKKFAERPDDEDSWAEAIAPESHIPDVKERAIPHYLTRGTEDPLITDEAVKSYMDALVKAGQRVEYVQVGGAGHAFFDWKPDEQTKATFAEYGVYYCREMEAFFNSILYSAK
jgi:acetyl esterase